MDPSKFREIKTQIESIDNDSNKTTTDSFKDQFVPQDQVRYSSKQNETNAYKRGSKFGL